MLALARGQTSDCAFPALVLTTREAGELAAATEVSFQIWDWSNGLSPTLAYPSSGRQQVDLADCPDGDKLEDGQYVARWTVPALATVGRHELRWFYKLSPSGPEQVGTLDFVVQALYASVQQMRDEGVSETLIDDTALQARLELCSTLIEEWTGRWFYPRRLALTLDGSGGSIIQLGVPIISIARVRTLYYDWDTLETEDFEEDSLRVYNRHLTQYLLDPDDRNNPKLEWMHSGGVFTRGNQNIEVSGVFGYTDPDGSPTGKTPRLINHVCKLLCVRELPKLGNVESRDESMLRGRVTSLRTRDQQITFNATKAGVGWTGDPAIDTIIARYRRPPSLGAA